jgi:hypothetical protein
MIDDFKYKYDCYVCDEQGVRYCEDCGRPICIDHLIELDNVIWLDVVYICSECNTRVWKETL